MPDYLPLINFSPHIGHMPESWLLTFIELLSTYRTNTGGNSGRSSANLKSQSLAVKTPRGGKQSKTHLLVLADILHLTSSQSRLVILWTTTVPGGGTILDMLHNFPHTQPICGQSQLLNLLRRLIDSHRKLVSFLLDSFLLAELETVGISLFMLSKRLPQSTDTHYHWRVRSPVLTA